MQEYRIRINTGFDNYLRSWFEDCVIDEFDSETDLIFKPADQASLFGMLKRVQNLGLPLIEVVVNKTI